MSRPISELLALIQSAVYGKDVRGAIHDSIEQCYSDVSTSSTAADTAASAANSAATAASNAAANAESAATAANVAAAEASQYSEELAQKANIDGYYEELTSGSAEQLLSSKFTEDAVPYVYRKTGGSIDVGNRKMEQIVGGTIVWNQLYTQGPNDASTTDKNVTVVDNRNGSYTVSTTADGASETFSLALRPNLIRKGTHVYFKGGANLAKGIHITDGWSGWNLDMYSGRNYGVFRRTDVAEDYVGYSNFTLYIPQGTVITEPVTFWPQYCDLTVMFGATVANYLYSLQSGTSNAGAEIFKSMFQLDHYAYNEGELMSVHTTQHETIGFNQWDEEWELGTFGTTSGENIARTDQIRSKNFIPVVPGARYWFGMPIGAAWTMFFDENQNIVDPPELDGAASWLTSGHCVGISTRTFTMPQNAHYIRFYMTQSYGNTYKNDICLNLSWTGYRNGEYEPYAKHVYALDDDLTLLGIPKLDANNHIYYDGDTYDSDGTVTRKYRKVHLGDLTWSVNTAKQWGSSISDARGKESSANIVYSICSHFITDPVHGYGGNGNVACITARSGYIWLYNPAWEGKTGAEVKALLNGVYYVYGLQDEYYTTEQATPYANPQIVDDFGTEQFIDTRPVAVPVGHSTKYMSNLRDKLQHLPDLAASDGDYMIHQANGQTTLTPSSLPAAPSQNGNYILKCTVSNGTPTYSWEAQS